MKFEIPVGKALVFVEDNDWFCDGCFFVNKLAPLICGKRACTKKQRTDKKYGKYKLIDLPNTEQPATVINSVGEGRMKQVFYVYCPTTYYTRFSHETFASAKKEAERLAREFPGRRFQILSLTAECVKKDITWESVDTPDLPF